jgi:tyrosine-protein phosphatase YwqE
MNIVGMHAGSVEYDINDAAVDIDELIRVLEDAKQDGATRIVGFSGNYRGAQYVRLSTDITFLDDSDAWDAM